MQKNTFTMRARVWLYHGPSAWHFITLPKKQSATIKKIFGEVARGWGSLPVGVTIGGTTWKTSIFPDKKTDAYLLPLKADIRRKEDIAKDDMVTFSIEIRV
ncbi:MAG: DUF1905 domain-containing protein [Candidatus Ryanbacteria bacterium]|nr:DUF1905 domain-containing protein [Candidatus Ryanbacteria bacterium]